MKNLVALVLSTFLAGCGTYETQSYAPPRQYPPPIQCPPQPQHQPSTPPQNQPPRWRLVDPCTQPRVMVNELNPRFRDLKPHHFFACSYDESNEKINFRDERWIYHSGEKFIVFVAVPRSLYGSKVNFVLGTPANETIFTGNIIASEEADNSNYVFSVNKLLQIAGEGDYRCGWGFDGELACLMYIGIRR